METAGGGSACVLGAHDRRKKRDVRRPLRAVNSSPPSVLCSARAGAGVGAAAGEDDGDDGDLDDATTDMTDATETSQGSLTSVD